MLKNTYAINFAYVFFDVYENFDYLKAYLKI